MATYSAAVARRSTLAALTALIANCSVCTSPAVAATSVFARVRVESVLPTAAPARLEVLDVRGRQVAERMIAGAGRQSIALRGALTPGVYVVRLSQEGQVQTARATVLR